jgi:hypothetical protein
VLTSEAFIPSYTRRISSYSRYIPTASKVNFRKSWHTDSVPLDTI